MLASILIASFVVVCTLATIAFALKVIRHERRNRVWLEQQIQEDIEAGVFPEWLWERRMDVPGKYPAFRTRSTKALR